jgi:NADPH2:quinone reductase
MRAIVVGQYGNEDQLKLREVPRPVTGPGRLLVRLHSAGVNPVDTYLRSGIQGYTPVLPFTPGMDGAGVIEEIGDGVIGFEPGMKVYVTGSVTGTYAEYCLCAPAQVWPLPESLGWAEGACLGVPYHTAARALFTKGNLEAGQTLLVHGATGGVGTACLQLASGRGVRVLGTAGTEEGLEYIRANGADECFSHRDPQRFQAMRRASEGRGIDLIIEMLANVNLDDDLKLLAPGGRVVVVGSRGRIEIAPRDLMSAEGTVTAVKSAFITPDERREYARLIAEGAAEGRLRPPVDAVFPLNQSAAAHRKVMAGPHRGNLVLGTA